MVKSNFEIGAWDLTKNPTSLKLLNAHVKQFRDNPEIKAAAESAAAKAGLESTFVMNEFSFKWYKPDGGKTLSEYDAAALRIINWVDARW